jgi:hypothetical protein
MKTKERLAAVLEEAGLRDLAMEARRGRFDDYDSDSPTPIRDLVDCLRLLGREDLARRAIDGEWDGTAEEAQAWYEREGKHLLEAPP